MEQIDLSACTRFIFLGNKHVKYIIIQENVHKSVIKFFDLVSVILEIFDSPIIL